MDDKLDRLSEDVSPLRAGDREFGYAGSTEPKH